MDFIFLIILPLFVVAARKGRGEASAAAGSDDRLQTGIGCGFSHDWGASNSFGCGVGSSWN